MHIKCITSTQSHVSKSIPVVHSGNSVHSGKRTHPLFSQQIFVMFSINGRIRLLSLMSESLKGVPSVSLRVGSVYYLSRVMSKPAFAYAKTKVQISSAITALISTFVFAT